MKEEKKQNKFSSALKKFDPIFIPPFFVMWGIIGNIREFLRVSAMSKPYAETTHYITVALSGEILALAFFTMAYMLKRLHEKELRLLRNLADSRNDELSERMKEKEVIMKMYQQLQIYEKELQQSYLYQFQELLKKLQTFFTIQKELFQYRFQ